MSAEPEAGGAQATDDFSRQKVPQDRTYGGLHIALIIVGGVIGIPCFLQAAAIGGSLGLQRATLAFAVGCLILGSLGALTSYVGARTRFSTYMLTDFAFGRLGAKFVNFVIAVTLVGWYAVISNVFAQAAALVIDHLYGISIPLWTYIVVGSALMVGVTVSGFKGIDRLALFMVPLMMVFLGHAAYRSWDDVASWNAPAEGLSALSYSAAVSSVVGGYIVGVVIQPDYSRFARSIAHAMWSVFIALWIVQGLVFFLAAVPSVATGESDLIKIMLALGIGLPAFLLLLLSSWCSNVLCLYSSGLSLATITVRVSLRRLILLIGVIGTALAFAYSQQYFIDFLIILGVSIPPVASIYVLDATLVRRGEYTLSQLDREPPVDGYAFAAWAIAVLVGYLANGGVLTISGIASMDSILVAMVVYCALKMKRIRWRWGAAGAR